MDPPGKTPPGIIRYLVSYFSFKSVSLVHKIIPNLQPKVTIPIPKDHFCFYFFIHNKDQMYIPKQDDAFGSSYFFKGLGAPSNKSYYRSYLVTRTRWKTISTPNQRCDDGNSAANTTTCITRYIEQKVGCSMGLQGTDPNLSRYPNLSFISDLKSIL